MGLYQSEVTKQTHLRKMQKREWELMKKNDKKQMEKELAIEKDQREENLAELAETDASKKLASAMVKSSLGKKDDTLQRAVDLLQNQNGNFLDT